MGGVFPALNLRFALRVFADAKREVGALGFHFVCFAIFFGNFINLGIFQQFELAHGGLERFSLDYNGNMYATIGRTAGTSILYF